MCLLYPSILIFPLVFVLVNYFLLSFFPPLFLLFLVCFGNVYDFVFVLVLFLFVVCTCILCLLLCLTIVNFFKCSFIDVSCGVTEIN